MKSAREKYGDIIDMPRHLSKSHPQMPVADRAAQFSPFAALTGHDAALRETARITDKKLELDDGEISIINEKLRFLKDTGYPDAPVTIEYFVKDSKKSGGKYLACLKAVKRIDEAEGRVVLRSGETIPVEDICAIDGDIFSDIGN